MTHTTNLIIILGIKSIICPGKEKIGDKVDFINRVYNLHYVYIHISSFYHQVIIEIKKDILIGKTAVVQLNTTEIQSGMLRYSIADRYLAYAARSHYI